MLPIAGRRALAVHTSRYRAGDNVETMWEEFGVEDGQKSPTPVAEISVAPVSIAPSALNRTLSFCFGNRLLPALGLTLADTGPPSVLKR